MKRARRRVVLALFLVVPACAARGPADGRSAAGSPSEPHAHHDAADSSAAQSNAAQARTAQADEHQHHAVHQHGNASQPLPATGGPGYTAADVRFMQDMIGHHEQALVMAVMAPTHGAGEMVLRLAEKIDISQRDEIDMMKRWLAERKQAIPQGAHAHAHMPGMLTEAQLARLDAARGREFERLFLEFMIQHHEGALLMVEALFASPGAGQDSEIFRFATDVDADQRDEIDVMHHMLDILAANPGSQRE